MSPLYYIPQYCLFATILSVIIGYSGAQVLLGPILLLICLFFIFSFRSCVKIGFRDPLLVTGFSLITLPILVNYFHENEVHQDAVKLIVCFFGAFIGYGIKFSGILLNHGEAKENYKYYYMMLLPSLFAALAAIFLGVQENTPISIFVNRNNAVFYTFCVIAYICSQKSKISDFFSRSYLVAFVGPIFLSMGGVAASILAIIIASRKWAIIFVLSLLVWTGSRNDWDFLGGELRERVWVVEETLKLFLLPYFSAENYNYGEMVVILNTTDLSFFFRIKHWSELWNVWMNSGVFVKFFGFGIGQSVFLTELGLVPHNDYLRSLIEMGVIGGLGFIWFVVVTVVVSLKTRAAVPMIAASIYFVSDNLINNMLGFFIYSITSGGLLAEWRIKNFSKQYILK